MMKSLVINHPYYLILNKLDHLYYRILTKIYIKKVATIMDIGCGKVPEKYIKPKIHYCIDPYLPYLNAIDKTNDRFWVMIKGDWKTATEIMREVPIDSVFLIDIIEHIDKKEAIELLKITESLVSEQIIVFTPLGYFEQSESEDGKDGWGMDGTEFQKHKSGWCPDDFGSGWKVWKLPYSHIVNNLNHIVIPPHGALLAIFNKKDMNID